MKRLVKHRHGLLEGVVESAFLQEFKNHVDVVLRDMAEWWLGSAG